MSDKAEPREIDPVEVLRAMLAIKPEDAKEVRDIADVRAKPDAAIDPKDAQR